MGSLLPRRAARNLVAIGAVASVALIGAACSKSDNSATGATKGSETTTTNAAASGGADAPARPSPGCGTARPALAGTKTTIKVAGADRWWLMTAPAQTTDSKPVPLVVDLHGLLEGAAIHTAMSGMPAFGAKNGFAVAEPNGTGSPIHWDIVTDKTKNVDLQFILQMVTDIGKTSCIDTARVYATGLSNGAFLTSTLACSASDVFAAFAPVSGVQFNQDCPWKRSVPILVFHGTDDRILKFNGGFGGIPGFSKDAADPTKGTPLAYDLDGPGYPEAVRQLAAHNKCEAKPTDSTTKTGETATPEIIRRTYSCPAGADVVFDVIVGGGHAWPGSATSKATAAVVGPTTMKLDANAEIWSFFQKFSLPQG